MNTPTPPARRMSDEQEQEQAQQQSVRLNSRDLLRQTKSVEIEHDGKVYQLRLTRLNKLILTA